MASERTRVLYDVFIAQEMERLLREVMDDVALSEEVFTINRRLREICHGKEGVPLDRVEGRGAAFA